MHAHNPLIQNASQNKLVKEVIVSPTAKNATADQNLRLHMVKILSKFGHNR